MILVPDDLNQEQLSQAFAYIYVPLEGIAMLLLAGVYFLAWWHKVYESFPNTLFQWVLLVDFFHGFFGVLRWSPIPTVYTKLGNINTMSPGMCTFNAFVDSFFQIGSLYTNTVIVGIIFVMVFYPAAIQGSFPAHIRRVVIVGFWLATLVLSVFVFAYPTYRGVGWCISNSVASCVKQATWYVCMALQVIMVVPTQYRLYYNRIVSRGTYIRYCGTLVSQALGLIPGLVVEFKGLLREPLSKCLLQLVIVGLPLAHIFDALLMSTKVLQRYGHCEKLLGPLNLTTGRQSMGLASPTGLPGRREGQENVELPVLLTSPVPLSSRRSRASPTPTGGERDHERRCKCEKKCPWLRAALLLIAQFLFVVGAHVMKAYGQRETFTQANKRSENLAIVPFLSPLIFALAKEDGVVPAFLRTQGGSYNLSYMARIMECDEQIDRFTGFVHNNPRLVVVRRPEVQDALANVTTLREIRLQVRQLAITVDDAIAAYYTVSFSLVRAVSVASNSDRSTKLSSRLFAFSSILSMRVRTVLATIAGSEIMDAMNAYRQRVGLPLPTSSPSANNSFFAPAETQYPHGTSPQLETIRLPLPPGVLQLQSAYVNTLSTQEPPYKVFKACSTGPEHNQIDDLIQSFVLPLPHPSGVFLGRHKASLELTYQDSLDDVKYYLSELRDFESQVYDVLTDFAQQQASDSKRAMIVGFFMFISAFTYFSVGAALAFTEFPDLGAKVLALEQSMRPPPPPLSSTPRFWHWKSLLERLVCRKKLPSLTLRLRLVIGLVFNVFMFALVMQGGIKNNLFDVQGDAIMADELRFFFVLADLSSVLSSEMLAAIDYVSRASQPLLDQETKTQLLAKFRATDDAFKAYRSYIDGEYDEPTVRALPSYKLMVPRFLNLSTTRQLLFMDSANSSTIDFIYSSLFRSFQVLAATATRDINDGTTDSRMLCYLAVLMSCQAASNEQLGGSVVFARGSFSTLLEFSSQIYNRGLQISWRGIVNIFGDPDTVQAFTEFEEDPIRRAVIGLAHLLATNNSQQIAAQSPDEWDSLALSQVNAFEEMASKFYTSFAVGTDSELRVSHSQLDAQRQMIACATVGCFFLCIWIARYYVISERQWHRVARASGLRQGRRIAPEDAPQQPGTDLESEMLNRQGGGQGGPRDHSPAREPRTVV